MEEAIVLDAEFSSTEETRNGFLTSFSLFLDQEGELERLQKLKGNALKIIIVLESDYNSLNNPMELH